MTTAIAAMRWWHLPEVAAIERATFPEDAWSPEQFWQELAQPTRHYVVAHHDGTIAGFAGSFVLAPDADVQTIAVDPGRQGRGIGAALLGALVDDAIAQGATHLMLEVRADNTPALALYERFGFARVSVRRRYYPDGTDAVIMRRDDRRPAGGSA